VDFWRSVDLYCERTDRASVGTAERASNAAFLLAAALIVRHCRARPIAPDARLLRAGRADRGRQLPLPHLRDGVAGWLDVIFILAFIYVFFARFLARVPGWAGRHRSRAGRVLLFSRALTAAFPPTRSTARSAISRRCSPSPPGRLGRHARHAGRPASHSPPAVRRIDRFQDRRPRLCAPGRSGRTRSGTA